RQIGRHLLQGQWLTEQVAERRDDAAVTGEDRDARPTLGDRQLIGVRQGQREIAERAAADYRAPQSQEEGEPQRAPEKASPGASLRRATAIGGARCGPPVSHSGGGRALARIDAQRRVSHRSLPARIRQPPSRPFLAPPPRRPLAIPPPIMPQT